MTPYNGTEEMLLLGNLSALSGISVIFFFFFFFFFLFAVVVVVVVVVVVLANHPGITIMVDWA